jgi:hypothetical protein
MMLRIEEDKRGSAKDNDSKREQSKGNTERSITCWFNAAAWAAYGHHAALFDELHGQL